jgi:hypothetical protein
MPVPRYPDRVSSRPWSPRDTQTGAWPRRATMKALLCSLFLLLVLGIAVPGFAQCPADFVYIGRMERSTPGLEVKDRVRITIPPSVTLDTSYQQTPSPPGKGGRADSILSRQIIPSGLCIVADGRGSYGWAVSDPRMVDARTFEMYLYCSQDQGVFNLLCGPETASV